VVLVLFVLAARLEQVGVGCEHALGLDGEWLREDRRIVERHLEVHVAEVAPADAFGEAAAIRSADARRCRATRDR
jgi:hypothetical protein